MLERILVGIAIVVGCAGCATVPMGDVKRDQELKAFRGAPDRSGIYIYRNESIGGAVRMDVEIDGTPIGQTAAKTYLYKEVTPGKHTVTSKSENTHSIEIETVSGKLYYIWQEVKMGLQYARTKLHLVPEDEGQRGVRETKLAETKWGTIVTTDSNVVRTQYFSIVVPPDRGWHRHEDASDLDAVVFNKRIDSTLCTMRFSRNWIASTRRKEWTAREVADDYRKGEEGNMISQGVMSGQYELKEVVHGTEMIEGKQFYTMNYTTIGKGAVQIASLFLYFPADKNVEHFFVALYSEGSLVGDVITRSAKDEFIETLRSLKFGDESQH